MTELALLLPRQAKNVLLVVLPFRPEIRHPTLDSELSNGASITLHPYDPAALPVIRDTSGWEH